MTPRLTSDLWVSAYLRRLQLVNIPAFITSKGDANAGVVIVKINTLDGNACAYHRSYDLDGNRVWETLAEGLERDVDASLNKQRSFDPDIWVIEVEERQGRHLLDEDGLSG
jgi:hypothetical protein